jgi:hypothetical protein
MADELQGIPGIGQVVIGFRGLQEIPSADMPAICLTFADGGTRFEQPSQQVVSDVRVLVTGYVRTEHDDEELAREDFYESVYERLHGSSMQARLEADLLANNSRGAILIRAEAEPDTDKGLIVGHGWFDLAMIARMHTSREDL